MLALLFLAFASADAPPAWSPPVVSLGPIRDMAGHALLAAPDVEFAPCVTRPVAPLPPPSQVVAPVTGQIVLQITVRQRRAEVVAVSVVDADYAWLAPCVERQIATVRWPVRAGKFEVPLVVTPPSPSPPALSQP